MFENFSKKIGDFAQNAAKKSGEFAQTAAKKSGEMVEITKLNMSITSEENSIEKLYVEIGKLCYSSSQAGTELDGSIAQICKKIKGHKDAIAEIKEKINAIKNAEE